MGQPLEIRVLAAVLFGGAIAWGQPAFDVTVVRPVADRRGAAMECPPDGHFLARGLGLGPVISWAFDLDFFQMPALPAPAGSTLFHIEGKAANPVPQQVCKQMVQTLLKDRFKMAIRSEPREVPVYALVVAGGGLRMTPVTAATKDPGAGLTVNSSPYPNSPSEGWSMDELRRALGSAAFAPDRPVVDRTGLTGRYNVALNIVIGGTDLFSAAGALGLRVESRKEMFPVFIVDRLEMPDEN